MQVNPANNNITTSAYIYALGRIEPRFPSPAVEKEFAQATGRAGWTGTVAALMYLPSLVLGPLAGALADRTDRRRLLSILTTAQTPLAAVLAALLPAFEPLLDSLGELPVDLLQALFAALDPSLAVSEVQVRVFR